uniref:Uncharacterized protein n=1 Tax=Vitis vinifera TaxID=29760 RepID=A5B4D7_VITVI|nr:hypothetical protein VITISV_023906 [Vitis vinifera]
MADAEAKVPDYRLLLSCPSGLSPSQVSVDFSERFDRIPHPDISLDNSISEIWDGRVQQNASLYNGTKFRDSELSIYNLYFIVISVMAIGHNEELSMLHGCIDMEMKGVFDSCLK